ncbi:MAG: DNA translocase FtsK 4TM domain-containing protein [Patescibacteria group bacterium]
MSYRKKKRNKLKFLGKNRKTGYSNLSDLDDLGFGKSWRSGNHWQVGSETKKGIFIIILFLLAALSLLGLFDLSGEFGRVIVHILSLIFGGLNWLFPVLAIILGYFLLRPEKYQVRIINYIGGILLVLGATSLWHLWYLRQGFLKPLALAKEGLGGGFAGFVLSAPLLNFMGLWGAAAVCLAILLVGILLTFETSLYGLMWPIRLLGFLGSRIKEFYLVARENSGQRIISAEDDYEESEEEKDLSPQEENEEEREESTGEEENEPQFKRKEIAQKSEEEAIVKPKKFGRKIELPISLLTARPTKPTSGDIKANQEIIRKTLANFGIEVEMGDVNIGPTVTQYTLRPADGVKLSRIIVLNSDLALALAAHPIRIEAPIPGKSLVGIEVPNKLAARVTMGELLSSREFQQRSNNLFISLGKDVSGKACFAQLDRMPHLLIAGATGSGKSVCINSIIVSLLYQNSPDDLKFILVDPKRVELPIYNNIPYLLTPVITDVKKTINALKWTIVEMEKRFELLSRMGKRNIAAYNQAATDKLPYIIFIIDELADLMSTAANDVEAGIVRLAQMARAVGIHLILATQRPSVEVITGLIKANIPARVAFSVASLIDSRTILDSSGAEKLVGRGDMLFLGPEISKPKRIQGVFMSDQEIKSVVDYIRCQGEANYLEEIVERPAVGSFSGGAFASDDGDPLMGEAKEIIRQSGKASASLLQRRLKLGYARAARILDLLEEEGVIGPADGAKPREVFLDKLGGVDALNFAAREHDLTGELVEAEEFEEETEGENTVFDSEAAEDLEAAEEEEEEEKEEEEEEDKIEPKENMRQNGADKKAKNFADDEWT